MSFVCLEDCSCFVGDLLHGFGADGRFAEDGAYLLFLDLLNYLCNLLWSTFLRRVDRPKVDLIQTGIAAKIRKSSFARYQRALVLRQGREFFREIRGDLLQFILVRLAVFCKVIRVVGNQSTQALYNVVDVDLAICGRHPCVWIGFSRILSFRDVHGSNPLAQIYALGCRVGDKTLKPALKSKTIVEDQVGFLGKLKVFGRWFIIVNLCSRLCDGLHVAKVARNICSHVLDDRERGKYERFFCFFRLRGRRGVVCAACKRRGG